MIKNVFVQLIFRLIILGAMVYGLLLSVGVFYDASYFYVWYTNISNYFCLLVVLLEIIWNIISICKKDFNINYDKLSCIKFVCLISIAITFLIENIMFNSPFKSVYWQSMENIFMHFICPIAFWLDWLLFASHGKSRWYYPLVVTVFPFAYMAFIFIRASVLNGATGVLLYPYFFLDVATLGVAKVVMWIGILTAAFVAFGYIIYLLDNVPNIIRKRKNR